MKNYELVLVWVVSLSFEACMAGCEVVWVNRNVTDSFRVGEGGCANDTSVCTNVSATCQDDGSCLCDEGSPNFRNPVIERSHGRYMHGNTHGCIGNSEIRSGVETFDCMFKPFQVLQYSHTHGATNFSQNEQLGLGCSAEKILVKFPDNATEVELQWLNESYFNISVSGKDLLFKWKRSVPALRGTIITFNLRCQVTFQSYITKCLRAKILGRSPEGTLNFPTTTEPTASSAKIKSSSSTTSTPPVETITSAITKSTVGARSDEKSSDSTSKIFIALFSICIVVIIVLGIIVGYLWKDRKRLRSKNLQTREMENIEGNRKRDTDETSSYDEVVDSGMHNDGMNRDSFPSSGKKNNNEDPKYEEPSNYEPLRRNPLQQQKEEHNYQSLQATRQKTE